MANFDSSKPEQGSATTQSVRDNFAALKELVDTPAAYGDIIWSGNSTSASGINIPERYRVRSSNIGSWVYGGDTDSTLLFVVIEPTVSESHFREWQTYVVPVMIRWPLANPFPGSERTPIQRRNPYLYTIDTLHGVKMVLQIYFSGHELMYFYVKRGESGTALEQDNDWWRITEIRSLSRKAGN